MAVLFDGCLVRDQRNKGKQPFICYHRSKSHVSYQKQLPRHTGDNGHDRRYGLPWRVFCLSRTQVRAGKSTQDPHCQCTVWIQKCSSCGRPWLAAASCYSDSQWTGSQDTYMGKDQIWHLYKIPCWGKVPTLRHTLWSGARTTGEWTAKSQGHLPAQREWETDEC